MRSTTMGYGMKMDFTKSSFKRPAPNKYNIQGIFDLAKAKHRGYSFGLGRENMKSCNFLNLSSYDMPGPGAYDNKYATLEKEPG